MRLAAIALAVALAALWASSAASPAERIEATVVYVDDGDTIDVRTASGRERVRYIGIDAPEVAHGGEGGAPGGDTATGVNRDLVGGRRVRLEMDVETRDRYGRLLAYVWLGDTMVNLEMVRRGYARALTIPPNVRHDRSFRDAEFEARAARRGLWSDPTSGFFLPSPPAKRKSVPFRPSH